MTTQARPFLLDDLRADIRDQVYDHVFASDDVEVGGVLVGDVDATGKAEVHGMIAALEADGARASVTFTHEAWQEIIEVQERDFPDSPVIVGWYHSHPGFGIFLSEHDNFIHKNFFREPFHLAYVIDPQDEVEGIFGWRDGEIALFERGRTPRRRAKRRPTVVVSLDEIEAAEAPTLVGEPLEVVPDDEPDAAAAASSMEAPRSRRRMRGLVAVGLVAAALGAVAVGLSVSDSGSSAPEATTTDIQSAAPAKQARHDATALEIAKAKGAVRAAQNGDEVQQRAHEDAKRRAAAELAAARLRAQQGANEKPPESKPARSNPPSLPPRAPTPDKSRELKPPKRYDQ